MANFHLEFKTISRRQGRSPISAANYQSGERLHDDYYGRTYYNRDKSDVLHTEVLLPLNIPPEYNNRQALWREVDKAEKRSDARTARRVIGSLPNELSLTENIELVREYVTENFISLGMCADIAIHEIKNEDDPTRDNIHFHALLTDRPITSNGFALKKNRDWNNRIKIKLWRERWAEAQNRAYERKGLNVRVTEKSYINRGVYKREPKRYLQPRDMILERSGIRTERGDENREIKARNKEHKKRMLQKKREKKRGRER